MRICKGKKTKSPSINDVRPGDVIRYRGTTYDIYYLCTNRSTDNRFRWVALNSGVELSRASYTGLEHMFEVVTDKVCLDISQLED